MHDAGITKKKVVIATVAASLLILVCREFYGYSPTKIENTLVHEPKSLIPASQNWAQDQFYQIFKCSFFKDKSKGENN